MIEMSLFVWWVDPALLQCLEAKGPFRSLLSSSILTASSAPFLLCPYHLLFLMDQFASKTSRNILTTLLHSVVFLWLNQPMRFCFWAWIFLGVCGWLLFVWVLFGFFFENNTFFAALWFVCAYCTNTLIKLRHTFPHLVFPWREDPPLECISHNSVEGCECQVNHSFQKCVGRGREWLSVPLLHITYLNFLCLPSPLPSCRVQRWVFQCFLFLKACFPRSSFSCAVLP